MDLALRQTSELSLDSDIVVDGASGMYLRDPKLHTAVKLSLFCRARALPGDELPQGEGAFGEDLGGWWGGDIGSRLWTLRRSGLTDRTRQKARDFALESLEWLKELGIASDVLVDTSIPARDCLRIDVRIVREDGATTDFEFDYLWGEL